MHLQAYESGLVQRIANVGRRDAVHPYADVVALCLDSIFVPFVVFERGTSGRIAGDVVQPAPACLIVDAARCAGFLVRNFDLIAMDTSGRKPTVDDLLAVEDLCSL